MKTLDAPGEGERRHFNVAQKANISRVSRMECDIKFEKETYA
jgi:hypothetical protein